ncbi:phosphoadenylyl-sulfate reductase [Brachybacterium sp. FME24]|uniref:phosphoadenylyl-sulfate reductase n=1 Tax=Brachybacterium sp. FME24 TaxID=2742605 RepID=UPI001866D06A|nr:phosphoadenylyl-sulfate reductase [Brachybacterium sp. FME24]
MSTTKDTTAATADRAQRTARLRALADDASQRFAALEDELGPDELAEAASAWAAQTFGRDLAVACSMADAVLPHVVARHQKGVDVLFLETGYHFPETLETRDRVARELDVTVVDVLPERTVPEQDTALGARLHDRDPATCCALRKVDPLRKALSGYDAWVTGVRREEGPTRANAPLISYDESFDLVKINPLVTWSFGQLMGYSHDHGLPENPLLQQGFPSIGCAPCTRAVAPGEDPRAGRWAASAKTECGLHSSSDSPSGDTLSGGASSTVTPLSLLTVDTAQENR